MFEIFIRRPILSGVISVVIVFLGLLAITSLPITQFPDIVPPSVTVTARYTGANADVMAKTVATPLERAINGVPGMTYMTTVCTNDGMSLTTIYFKVGTDPDVASVNVQNRVTTVLDELPEEVIRAGVITEKEVNSMLMYLNIMSTDSSHTEKFVYNFADINILRELKRIDGVGFVEIMGSRDYAMRVWLNPNRLAAYNMSPQEVTAAIRSQNIEAAPGKTGISSDKIPQQLQYVLQYSGKFSTPEEYGEIVLKALPDGSVLRLKDVATIEFDSEDYNMISMTDGKPSASIMIKQRPGSNAREVIQNIKAKMEEIKESSFAPGMDYNISYDVSRFLDASISVVLRTLLEAFLLVFIVVYLFLQDFRSTLIPAIAVPVSLVGTFFFMQMLGFSINMLTLFALVLAIGIVVDNAIVVVEAVQARFDVGYKSSYMASIDAMKGISNAVITSSLVFMAVFIPVSFMGGTSGTFYTQFGLTMAVAVGISAINALTLSPALCALLLKPYINEDGTEKNNFASRFRKAFNTAFEAVVEKYKKIVLLFIKRRWLGWSLLALSVVLLVFLMNTTKTGLVPDEDQGTLFVNVSTAPGSSLKMTNDIIDRVEKRLEDLPQKLHLQKVAGYGLLSGQGNSFGMIIVKLKPWDERTAKEDQVQAVVNQIYARTADIKDATVFAIAPGMIPGYGMGNALDLNVQDKQGGDMNTFFQTTQQYLAALNQRPEISMAYSTFDVRYPQWTVEVDASKCKRAGITPDQVLSTLSGYYGGQYVSNFNRFSKVYKVMIQADPKFRLDEASLNNAFVRMSNGEMAPLSQFVTLTRSYGAESLSRFNMFNSIAVNAMPAEGYSTGDAIRAVQETAEIALPKGYGYDFGGITREESQQSGTTVIIFGICILMIYLILSALYESFLIPFAVILAVPAGLMGSFLFARIAGLENNIYLQTGLIMLIGLLAKTAILLTEYAAERRKAGMGLIASAVSAAKARFRPILMTVLTMIFGLFPLVVATGVGANGNRSLGTGVVGGMFIGTLALLFIVPVLFISFQWLQERLRPAQSVPTSDWQIEEEMKVSRKEIEESH